MDHATMAHISSSFWDNFSFKVWAKLKNVLTEESHFCSFPLTSAQTFRVKGHCQRRWRTVSSLEPQTAHLGSMGTLRRAKFAQVGRMSELACHTKFRTLGGIDNFHSWFQTGLSSCTLECSSFPIWFIRSATWYTVRTKNVWALFSFHISVSQPSKLPRRTRRTSSPDDGWNQALTFPLSHCLVCGFINSATLNVRSTPSWKVRVWGSYLWI